MYSNLKAAAELQKQGKTKLIPDSMSLAIGGPAGMSRALGQSINPPKLPKVSINELNIPSDIRVRLYNHQVEGVEWLYAIHLSQHGGILGDDMGLGNPLKFR